MVGTPSRISGITESSRSASPITWTSSSATAGTVSPPVRRTPNSAPAATAEVSWLREGEAEWPAGRSVGVEPPTAAMRYANVPLYRHADYAGKIHRYRIVLRGVGGATIALQSLITAHAHLHLKPTHPHRDCSSCRKQSPERSHAGTNNGG